MGSVLELKRKVDLVDEFIDYYKIEINSIELEIKNMNSSLEQIFKDRLLNIEKELELKKGKEETRILKEETMKLDRLHSDFSHKHQSILNQIESIQKLKESNVLKDLEYLELILKNKDTVINKLNEFDMQSSVQAIINRNDIPRLSRQQVIQLFKDAKTVESNLLNLEVQDIDLEFINKEFWFPAGKLEGKLRNPNHVTVLKFINVLGVVTLVGLYSGIITTGLLGSLTYYGVKNQSQWKIINQYRNWMHTIYEYSNELKSTINSHHQSIIEGDLAELNLDLEDLKEELKLNTKKINDSTEALLRTLSDNYLNERESKIEEVSREIRGELVQIQQMSKESLRDITGYMSEFEKKMKLEKSLLNEEFNNLNWYDLNIPNDKVLLDLNKIHLGVEKEHQDVNYFSNLPFGSYLFIHEKDRAKMRNLIKYLSVQLISRLKGNLLNVNILDPLSYGEGLSEIVDDKSIEQFYSDVEVSDKIDSLLDKFTKDIKNIFTGYDNILEFNEEKASIGSTPYPYTLNLIQNIDIFSDMGRFKQMLQTSKSGVINFILISSDVIEEVQRNIKNSDVKRAEFFDMMDLFVRLFTCSGEGLIRSGDLEGTVSISSTPTNPIKDLHDELVSNITLALNNLESTLLDFPIDSIAFKPLTYSGIHEEESRGEFREIYHTAEQFRAFGKQITENKKRAEMTIFYYKDFVNQVVPKGTEFQYESIKGINMPFGYRDGDIEKPFGIPIDGETIHIFMGGRTGMGKSNTLNVGLNTALRMYSPDDLHIYLMDFKVVEGKKYMVNPTPHFKCISVTEDPYYLISLFKYLIGLLKERQEVLLPSHNAGKIADIKKKGIKVPEIVVVIDEFTEALKGTDEVRQMILESSDTLARLGRASGVHLFFTSQDVSDKLPDGTLGQFAGRLSLPVSKADTSKQIILNPDAADPDYQEMGNLLFNNKGGDSKHNIRIKVPLIEPEDMNDNFELINRMCEGKYEMNCVMFDAEESKTEDELDFYLKSYKDLIKKTGKIILGGNAQFDTEDAPVGMDLVRDESQNIMIISQGKKRRVELTNTLIKNVAELEGKETVLFVLRGNKDYLDFNYIDKYEGQFNKIIELEDFSSIIDIIKGSRLAVLELELKTMGVNYSTDSENFEQFSKLPGFLDEWQKVIAECTDENIVILKKSHIARLIEAMRPYTPKALIVVEGADEVHGIGIDNYELKEHSPILRYAPYYGILNVWNTSKTPRGFTQVEGVFRHRLLGSLEISDLTEYKFMRETRTTYGGYMNIINPSGVFKYKIFRIAGLQDDEIGDNRIILK